MSIGGSQVRPGSIASESDAVLNHILQKAKDSHKRIVLPEGDDVRILSAAEIAARDELADIVILGKEKEIRASGLCSRSRIEIIDPKTDPNRELYIEAYFDLRRHKGITSADARAIMNDPLFYGAMMVQAGAADGMVGGANNTTAKTLRPALQIIRPKAGARLVSGFFIIIIPNLLFGHNGAFLFADSGLVENPNAEELAEIAVDSARSFVSIFGAEARVALLSYSTYGSAKSEWVEKVAQAAKLAKAQAPDLLIDGEMQLDAAVVADIGKKKAPGSPVAGRANVLIFPDLNSGNIVYKAVQRFADAKAYGLVTQGLAKPVNDLSRGCSIEDVVALIAITAVQAQAV